jgi:BirA family biotin operon repressor/biotin-[acetyl-CoA-carboxylase] ligase
MPLRRRRLHRHHAQPEAPPLKPAMEPSPASLRRVADRDVSAAGWGSQALWEQINPVWPGVSVEVVGRIASTNTALVERLRQAARNARERDARADDLRPTLLVAAHQTQGRGRLGRSWNAGPDASLTFSFAVPLQRADWSGLSLAVGVAVAEALDPASQWARLKWPNDLWVMDAAGKGRKLGGVLIEAMAVGERRVAVVGVGLNVAPPEHMSGTAALREFQPGATPASALARVGPALAQALHRFEATGFAGVAAAFAARDLLAGQAVVTTDAACPHGQALGVADDGALRVLCEGVEHRIVSGEVSVRPATSGGLPR